MNNTQVKVKQQVIDYLKKYEETKEMKLDNLFTMPKCEVYEFAKEFKKGKAYVYSKYEYMDTIKDSVNILGGNEKTKEDKARLLKLVGEKDFEAMFVSSDCKIYLFKDGDFEKQYLNDLVGEQLSEYRKEVIEITLLDTLWVTTEDYTYRKKCESKLYDLSEKIAYDVDTADNVEEVEYILGEIIVDNTANINNDYLDIEF